MIIYLTTAETDLLSLSKACERDSSHPWDVMAVNLTEPVNESDILQHIADHGEVVIMRLLGGRKACPHLFDNIVQLCWQNKIPLMAWPGDLEPSEELQRVTNVDFVLSEQAMRYAALGGERNFYHLLGFVSDHFLGTHYGYEPPFEEAWTGIYWPTMDEPLTREQWQEVTQPYDNRPIVAILFYRAHWLSRNLSFIDAIITELIHRDMRPLPVFTQSLKTDQQVAAWLNGIDAAIITMSFATVGLQEEMQGVSGRLAHQGEPNLLMQWDVPVFQALISLGSEKTWRASALGLGPLETAMNVAIPEFDGRIITIPISFREEEPSTSHGIRSRRYVTIPDRISRLCDMVTKAVRLRRTPVSHRRIAFVLTNYPSKNSRIGNAVGLDTPKSLVKLLHLMAQSGYDVGPRESLPESGDELMKTLIARGTHDEDYLTEEQWRQMAELPVPKYSQKYQALNPLVRDQVEKHWGAAPGQGEHLHASMRIPGCVFGNIFVGIQPPRGNGEDEVGIYHSPELPPSHHYIAYYQWIREEFQAHAVIHLGKHGTLEWLPGKGIGLSQDCFPDIVLEDLPNFYPFIVDDPGEGTQAKRRSHAVLIDHMVPPVTAAGLYDDLVKMQQLLDQYYQAETLDPSKLPIIQDAIWELAESIHLNRDLNQWDRPQDFPQYLLEIDGYLCELEARQIRDGLHILGQSPQTPENWGELLYAMARLPFSNTVPSMPEALCQDLGINWADFQDNLGRPYWGPVPSWIESYLPKSVRRTYGDVKKAVEQLAKTLLAQSVEGERPEQLPQSASVIEVVQTRIVPFLKDLQTETTALLHGLDGGYVPPGPSGAPTRGMIDVLPTGRNFYSVDPRSIPSIPAWQVGQRLAKELIEKYQKDHGQMPHSVGIVVWGTAAMRTGGDDVAEILALLGVRPVWEQANGRIQSLAIIPLEELGRPRVDVTVRISGFFRDAFRNVIDLIHQAVTMVAQVDEPLDLNPVRAHWLSDRDKAIAQGQSAEQAAHQALWRVFGSKPGSYGSGILPALNTGQWQNPDDLAKIYLTWSSYAYSDTDYGTFAYPELSARLARVQIATKNQDNREHDIFDSDDYLQDHGGMAASIRSLTGSMPDLYFGDSSDPTRSTVRSFRDEAYRVFRSRVVNPKWIQAAMRHDYKGALEMANTMDFLFGYDATADLLEDWMYDEVAKAYVTNDDVRQFFQKSNPWALKDIAERLIEAHQRGMWEHPDPTIYENVVDALMETENTLEEWGEDDD
ncbi:cobaltochelatase CobN subunit [Sulfobacillus thermosulfidooxidans DSM 9293]|uniref:Cobaltochelatase CobN subunit n=1 Tax=Sulfobacillus thermosulfidooxidans (strain DSM 9293 / VKM B-1269 / AT-1) TaxID=929705 RepID=A0A1W1WH37_SULTA|nr:cobaltochelatase subunit CobN [Sulfobacillus thermosulfidooxidans]SMC05566.1 cobaltochelatase CobN subunit [Sulfobacillus thermosulfidooxidans DSM 9293]